MRKNRLFLTVLLAIWPVAATWADLVVVANSKSGIDRMSREEVVYVFMGRWRQLPSGIPAQPIDAPIDSAERMRFYRKLVNKDPSDIQAYWARLVFSGGARPPVSTQNRDEQLKLLAALPGAVAYMERSAVDSRVKIVFEFSAPPP